MKSEGLESLFPIEDISVMGIWELLPHLYRIKVSCVEYIVNFMLGFIKYD
jgi:lipid-A-disaccharide synthase